MTKKPSEKYKFEPSALRRIFMRLGHYVLVHRASLYLAALFMAGAALIAILRPWPIKIIFDTILIPQENAGIAADWLRGMFGEGDLLLAICALSIFAIAVINGLLGYHQTSLLASVGQNVIASIRFDLYRHIQSLSQTFHDTTSAGDLLSRLTSDVRMLRDLLINSVMFVGSRLLVFIGTLTVMLIMDWQLALVSIAVLPALFYCAALLSRQIKVAAREQRRKEGKIAHVVTENLSTIKVVQAYAREAFENDRFQQQNTSSANAELAATKLEAYLDRLVKVFVAAGTCFVLWFGVTRVRAGALTPGDLIVFIAYLGSLYKPVKRMARFTSRVAKATVRGERILEIFDQVPEVHDQPDAVDARNIKGRIDFRNVGFAYLGGNEVLSHASFTVRAGETVAFLSASGSGKSTIAQLVLRLYEPQTGTVKLDNRDVRKYKLASLREQVSILLQDSVLFNATLRDNIGYGKLDASDPEIFAAARAANAHDFIVALPDGYDTVVGPRGCTLSGGERQRIAIARAMVRNAPIVILDEPTTGLDSKAENSVREALVRLVADKTCILIAHDKNVIRMADRVFEIYNGKVRVVSKRRLPAGGPASKERSGAQVRC